MTPMELLIATLIVWWMLRRLVVDAAAAIRGHAPPRWNGTASRRGGRAGPRRYGLRSYLADAWSDAWQDARTRRVAKREARAAGGGQTRTSRWLRLRQAMGARWDAAWGRWEIRQNRRDRARPHTPATDDPATGLGGQPGDHPPHQPRPGQTPPGGKPAAPGGGAEAHPPGPGPQQPNADQRRPGEADQGHDTDRSDPSTPAKEPGTVLNAHRVGDRWVTDTDHGPAAAAGPHPHRHQPGRNNPPTTGGTPMAEATGLTTSIAYAADMSKANEDNVAEAESWAASLQAQGVTGPAVEAAHRAMEAQQQAAEAWRQAQAVLESHLGIKEQYESHPDAGSREFVTSE